MQAESSSSLIGQALEDRYAIIREIGRGGMGVVYEAEHIELGKRVAIKVILDKYATDDEAVTRFKREALAASRIGNPHIIDVSHIGVAADGRPFVVMELLDGDPLSKILERTGPMPPWRAIHIIRQVLRAVGAAHNKGIIHRDLKPDNIFIVNRDDQHDFVKLLDFGISKMIETGEQVAATRLTTTGVVMGTPLYMAPEQAMGAPVDRGVDIYAAGVILFELLSGRPPFDEANYNMLVAKLITATPPYLGDVRKGLPASLCDAVNRALQKEPEHRFATADLFAQALPSERALSEPNLEIMHTLGPDSSVHAAPSTLRKPASKRRWLIGAGVGAVLGIAIAVVVATMDHADPHPVTVPAAVVPTSKPLVVPAPAMGKLQVKTIPPGAHVTLDGNDAGSTPIEVELAPGRHRIHVELANYHTVDEDEDIHVAERTSATIALEKVARKGGVASKATGPAVTSGTSHVPGGTVPNPGTTRVVTPYDDPPKSRSKGNPYDPTANPY